MICFRVVDHGVEQNHRTTLSMVFDFLFFEARRVHRSGQMAGYEICPPPGSGTPLAHVTTFVVPRDTHPHFDLRICQESARQMLVSMAAQLGTTPSWQHFACRCRLLSAASNGSGVALGLSTRRAARE